MKKLRGIEPGPKEVTVKTLASFFARVHDKKTNKLAIKQETLDKLSFNERLDLLELLSALEGDIVGLKEAVLATIPSPGDPPPKDEKAASEKAASEKAKPKRSRSPSRRRDAGATPPVLTTPAAETKAPVVVPSAAPPAPTAPAAVMPSAAPAPVPVAVPVAQPAMPPEETAGEARRPYFEGLMAKQAASGVDQLVILRDGAIGSAPCGPEAAAPFAVFVVDLAAGDAAWSGLAKAGFDAKRPALVTAIDLFPFRAPSLCVPVYRWVRTLAPGSALILTHVLDPVDAAPALRASARRMVAEEAAAGRPFVYYSDPEVAFGIAEGLGLQRGELVSSAELAARAGDGVKARFGEMILVTRT